MSHFTVLVIGEDVEKQLEPFDENKEVDRFVQYTKKQLLDKGKEEIETSRKGIYAEYLADPEAYKKDCQKRDHMAHFKYISEEFPLKLKWTDDQILEEQYKWYRMDEEDLEEGEPRIIGPDGEIYSTRNPESTWDWWLVGGRWTGFFKVKRGAKSEIGEPGVMTEEARTGWGDSLLKKDIDMDVMFDDAYDRAGLRWDEVHTVIDIHPDPEKWDDVRNRIKSIDEARDFYHDQPMVKAFSKWTTDNKEWDDLDPYLIDKKTFQTDAGRNAFITYAVLKDGKWYARGEMGWWGMSSNENNEWDEKFFDMLKEIPEDTRLTLVDCHI